MKNALRRSAVGEAVELLRALLACVCEIHLLVTVLAIPRYGGRAAGPGSLHHGKWVRDGGGIRVGLGDEGVCAYEKCI